MNCDKCIGQIIKELEMLNKRNKKDYSLFGDNYSMYLRLCALIRKLKSKLTGGGE